MCNTICYLIVFTFFLPFSAVSSDYFHGTWSGIEVMGTDQKTAQYIRSIVPIVIGAEFSSKNINEFQDWCNNVKATLQNDNISCSFIGYGGGKFYYDVEIKPPVKDKMKMAGNVSVKNARFHVPKNLSTLFDRWWDRHFSLVQSGLFPKEHFTNGHLDYDDEILHGLSEKMSKLSRKHNKRLLEVLRYSQDPDERSKAATLLSWSITPENILYILDFNLLQDPDHGVRNDLSRSMSFILDQVNNDVLLAKATRAFCEQATLPSHGDRNKALFSISALIKKNPKLTEAIDHKCKKTIEYIAQMSILPNVGGSAKDIIKDINQFKNEKNTYSN